MDETGEQRWHALGEVRLEREGAAILPVVHAYREDAYGEEVIRILSARRAEKRDPKISETGNGLKRSDGQ
ncbi:MAG: hypothetical protein DMG40_23865 [Acidobacteria bacterium]|nr:MAG: hypothetical protein DMG40_23865 [Acidobacteriota bacterium]